MKKEFVEELASRLDTTKVAAEHIYETFSCILKETLDERGEVKIKDIGKLSITTLPARTCRNPRTGESVKVAEKNVVRFKASKVLKEIIN